MGRLSLHGYKFITWKSSGENAKAREADIAVHCIGTNGIPTLLELLSVEPSSIKFRYAEDLNRLLGHLSFIKVHFITYPECELLTWRFLSLNGRDLAAASPEVVRLTRA